VIEGYKGRDCKQIFILLVYKKWHGTLVTLGIDGLDFELHGDKFRIRLEQCIVYIGCLCIFILDGPVHVDHRRSCFINSLYR